MTTEAQPKELTLKISADSFRYLLLNVFIGMSFAVGDFAEAINSTIEMKNQPMNLEDLKRDIENLIAQCEAQDA